MNKKWFGCAGLLVATSACASLPDEPEGDAETSEEPMLFDPSRETTGVRLPTCGAEQCFDIVARGSISYVAVEAMACDRRHPPTVRVLAGGRETVQSIRTLDARTQCGASGGAIEYTRLTGDHYTVCVSQEGFHSIGDVRIVWNADGQCRERIFEGDCETCGGGEGGAPGTTSSGGEPTTNATTSSGGEPTTNATTSSGGEPTTTTGTGGSTGGEGGSGQGGSSGGEGGAGGACPE